jgi:hypothetical protein
MAVVRAFERASLWEGSALLAAALDRLFPDAVSAVFAHMPGRSVTSWFIVEVEPGIVIQLLDNIYAPDLEKLFTTNSDAAVREFIKSPIAAERPYRVQVYHHTTAQAVKEEQEAYFSLSAFEEPDLIINTLCLEKLPQSVAHSTPLRPDERVRKQPWCHRHARHVGYSILALCLFVLFWK